ncbi:MAG: hypothetical protein PHG25_00570 [Candidatus Pacebacteria bacterium]|nr:hypothetical protein [Candidatus Paceibacterota bacterium]
MYKLPDGAVTREGTRGGHPFEKIIRPRSLQKCRTKRRVKSEENDVALTTNEREVKKGLDNEKSFYGIVKGLIRYGKVPEKFIGVKKSSLTADTIDKYDFKLFVRDPHFGKRFIKIQVKSSVGGAIHFMRKYHHMMSDIHIVIMDETMNLKKMKSELENIYQIEMERLKHLPIKAISA